MIIKNEEISTTCAFTGHRPEKLHMKEETVKQLLNEAIDRAIENGYTHFISGGCRGVDFWAAEHIISLKFQKYPITLELAIPCDTQADKWNQKDRRWYKYLLDHADKVTRLQQFYTPGCMQRRNQYMVNGSSLLIAVWNGGFGGTKNCIKYAEKKGITINLIQT